MKDFTFIIYEQLLKALKSNEYTFISFSDYLNEEVNEKFILLRHDVEKHYNHALRFAQLQYQLGIKGTYFFRILPRWFKPDIVEKIAKLGHEVGYHYDDLTKCNGNYQNAIIRFEKNLQSLRNIAPVQTICMDGSPLSKFDNKDLWKKYNYKNFDIVGEPYFDINFDDVYYITDTGRMWDGVKFSVRDKVNSQKIGLKFHSTKDIIDAANLGQLPSKLMLTFHPQRWNEKPIPWFKEMLFQNIKNQAKQFLVSGRNKNVD